MIMPIITMTIRTQLVHWLREHGLNLKLAVSAAWLYSLQPELLPDLPQVVIMMCFSFGLQDLVGRFALQLTLGCRRYPSCLGSWWTCWPPTSCPPRMSCPLSETQTRSVPGVFLEVLIGNLFARRLPLFCPPFGPDAPRQLWKRWTLCKIIFVFLSMCRT